MGKKALVGKSLANDSQFANIFPRPIIVLYGSHFCIVILSLTQKNKGMIGGAMRIK